MSNSGNSSYQQKFVTICLFFFNCFFCVFWGFFKAIEGIHVLYIYHIGEEEGSLGSQTTSGCGGLVQYQ